MARFNKNSTLSGLIGNMVLRNYNNTTYAYSLPVTMKNPQAQAQMMQRTKKQNIVNLYGPMKPALKDNFQGKVGKQSDYSMFVSCNLSQLPVYLTEHEEKGGCTQVVAPYIVAFGKMNPLDYQSEDGWLVSDIRIRESDLAESAKVYEFANSIIELNENWKDGDTLEFIYCHQKTRMNSDGTTPYAVCDYANIELNRNDWSKLSHHLYCT